MNIIKAVNFIIKLVTIKKKINFILVIGLIEYLLILLLILCMEIIINTWMIFIEYMMILK